MADSERELSGKVAIVTGAGRLRALAVQLPMFWLGWAPMSS